MVGDDSVRALASLNLRGVQLAGCPELTDDALESLTVGFPRLMTLEFGLTDQTTNAAVDRLRAARPEVDVVTSSKDMLAFFH